MGSKKWVILPRASCALLRHLLVSSYFGGFFPLASITFSAQLSGPKFSHTRAVQPVDAHIWCHDQGFTSRGTNHQTGVFFTSASSAKGDSSFVSIRHINLTWIIPLPRQSIINSSEFLHSTNSSIRRETLLSPNKSNSTGNHPAE